MSELERDEGWLLAVAVIVAGVALVALVVACGARDRAGLDVTTARSAHPPMTWPEVQPVPTDEAWVGWRADLFAGVAGVGVELTPEPEVEVSSVAIERQPSGAVVVTNPPESPGTPGGDVWEALRQCESSGDPTAVSPSGRYHGWDQFDQPTWDGAVVRAGCPEWAERLPSDAPPEVQ